VNTLKIVEVKAISDLSSRCHGHEEGLSKQGYTFFDEK